MKKISLAIALMMVAGGILTVHAEQPATRFKSSVYDVLFVSESLKDTGLIRVNLDDKLLIMVNRFFAFPMIDGKAVRVTEQPSLQYNYRENTLEATKKLAMPDGAALAEVAKKLRFGDQSISGEISVKALADISFDKEYRVFQEVLSLPTESLIGCSVESTTEDGKTNTFLIPRVFDKEKWGHRSRFDLKIKMIMDNYTATFTCSENAVIAFQHYGGKFIELSICPKFKEYELEIKNGAELKFNYTVTFEKL